MIDLNSFNPSFLVNSTDGVGHVELLEVRDVPNDEIELSIEELKNDNEEQGLIFNRWTLKYEVLSNILKNSQLSSKMFKYYQ